MNRIEQFLNEHQVMILDGAMATELEGKGLDLNDALWSAKVLAQRPEVIEQVHYEYFLAGADCAMTASYQATIDGFLKKGYTLSQAEGFIIDSVKIAAKARDRFWQDPKNREGRPYPLIVAAVGPYGAYLADGSEYRGDYQISEPELMDFHRRRMQLLLEAGADILACETVPCLFEAQAMAKTVGEFPDASCWISFSCNSEDTICDGTSIAVCAAAMDVFDQVAAVGINCTPPHLLPSLIRNIRTVTQKPIAVYPNSGEVYDPSTKTWRGTSEEGGFALASQSWYEAGARLIGGCCRTTPADIAQVFGWVKRLR